MDANNKKVLIFDFDGTIIDSLAQIVEIVNELAPAFRINKVEPKNIEQLRNLSSREILKKFKISFWKLPFLLYQGRKKFSQRIPNMKFIPGMGEVLLEIKKNGNVMGIITSNSEDNVKKFLRNNNMEIFDFVYSANDLFGKSNHIKKLVKLNGWNKEQIFYVGDETRDIEAADKAGVGSIAVSWGFNSGKALAEFNPDYLFNSPQELLKILN